MLVHRSKLIRQALAGVLAREEDLDIAWELPGRDDVLALAIRHRPDVILLDYAMPDAAAAGELCEQICARLPESRVLIIVDRRFCAGLLPVVTHLTPRVGTIAIEDSVQRLTEGIRQLMKGSFVLDVELAVAALNANKNPLTKREREILRLTLLGEPVKEIAAGLYLGAGTVRNYLSRAMAKMSARTGIEAARRAQETGWI